MGARLKHLIQTLRHKWYVLIAGRRLKVPLWRLLKHDLSKFSLAEFGAYARQFHGDRDDPDGFARAWLCHQNRNDHHWEYWISRSQHVKGNGREDLALPMPEIAIREMIADWYAAAKVYDGAWSAQKVMAWLSKNQWNMFLHPTSWERLVRILQESAIQEW